MRVTTLGFLSQWILKMLLKILRNEINFSYVSSGSFSVVKRGIHKQTGKAFAVKCIQKRFIKLHLLEREIKIMKKVLYNV